MKSLTAELWERLSRAEQRVVGRVSVAQIRKVMVWECCQCWLKNMCLNSYWPTLFTYIKGNISSMSYINKPRRIFKPSKRNSARDKLPLSFPHMFKLPLFSTHVQIAPLMFKLPLSFPHMFKFQIAPIFPSHVKILFRHKLKVSVPFVASQTEDVSPACHSRWKKWPCVLSSLYRVIYANSSCCLWWFGVLINRPESICGQQGRAGVFCSLVRAGFPDRD